MADRSAVQRIKELDNERAELFEQAKQEALERVHLAITELNALGLTYRLVDEEKHQPTRQKKMTTSDTRGRVKDAPCPVCGFQTDKPHDARAHRGQVKKKAFTAKELTDRGMTKV
jgi:hypothetical protein